MLDKLSPQKPKPELEPELALGKNSGAGATIKQEVSKNPAWQDPGDPSTVVLRYLL